MIKFVKLLKTPTKPSSTMLLRMLLVLTGCMVKVQGCSRDIFITNTTSMFKSICDFEKENEEQPQIEKDPEPRTENQLYYENGISDCSYLIKAPEGQRVKLIIHFRGDWADIRDGPYWDSPLVIQLKGVARQSLTSSGPAVRVTFRLGSRQRSPGCCVEYRAISAEVRNDNNHHANAAMLNTVVAWVSAFLVTVISLFLVFVCYKVNKKRRDDMEHVLLPEDTTSVNGETFAVEVELPNYDSLTNASTRTSAGGRVSTERCAGAYVEGSHPSGLDTCIRQSYLVCVQNANELVQGPNCHQAASVANNHEVDGSAEGASEQQQYLVRVYHADVDIGPPPLYEGDNRDIRLSPLDQVDNGDNSSCPLYDGDNQEDSSPPLYEGDNQDNRPPPLYESDNQGNSQSPLYADNSQENRPSALFEGDNQDSSPPPLYEGDNQDSSPPSLYEGDNQDSSPPPLYEGDN